MLIWFGYLIKRGARDSLANTIRLGYYFDKMHQSQYYYYCNECGMFTKQNSILLEYIKIVIILYLFIN